MTDQPQKQFEAPDGTLSTIPTRPTVTTRCWTPTLFNAIWGLANVNSRTISNERF